MVWVCVNNKTILVGRKLQPTTTQTLFVSKRTLDQDANMPIHVPLLVEPLVFSFRGEGGLCRLLKALPPTWLPHATVAQRVSPNQTRGTRIMAGHEWAERQGRSRVSTVSQKLTNFLNLPHQFPRIVAQSTIHGLGVCAKLLSLSALHLSLVRASLVAIWGSLVPRKGF